MSTVSNQVCSKLPGAEVSLIQEQFKKVDCDLGEETRVRWGLHPRISQFREAGTTAACLHREGASRAPDQILVQDTRASLPRAVVTIRS